MSSKTRLLSEPVIQEIGLSGLVIRFANQLSDAANRAALAFRGQLDAMNVPGIEETATSLTSTFVRYNPDVIHAEQIKDRVSSLVKGRDWSAQVLPLGRRLWRIPVALGGAEGPQFEEAAELAGLTPKAAADQIANARLRVLTLGFAPGQPYLGELPINWDIPRQTELTPTVPRGALVVAIRQLIIFSGPSPTGWRQIGLTGFHCFRPDASDPMPLRPGDEVLFQIVDASELDRLINANPNGSGGAITEPIP